MERTDYYELMSVRPELFEDGVIHIVKDEEIISEFEKNAGRQIGIVYKSAYNMVLVDLVYIEEGKYFAYERLVPTVAKGATVILPVCNGKFVLVKQYRHALRDFQYSLPRGYGENKLSAAENARKEIREELGAEATNIRYLGECVANSGISGDKVAVYACEVDSVNTDVREEGIVKYILVTEKELKAMLREGRVNDGFTMSAFALYLAQ